MRTSRAIFLFILTVISALTPLVAWNNVLKVSPLEIAKSGYEILRASPGLSGYSNVFVGLSPEGATNNKNPAPPDKIYPRADPKDVAYTISEEELRRIIHIPADFTYGRIPPVLFIPGTGATAGRTFAPNFGKLFKRDKVADPVYINIPYTSLNDAQTNGEYVAYAINYISSICSGRKVTTLSWSQGSLSGQWAFIHWPSTIPHVSSTIRISPDLHGTILTKIFGCPGLPSHGCVTSIAQQDYYSTFISTLRSLGGDSAFVPTTHIYTLFDEIVQPQFDPFASGYINDTRGVGVTNVQLQRFCTPFLPGGMVFNSHAGILHNSLAYALAKDAIVHEGKAEVERVDVPWHCAQWAARGLGFREILETAALIPLATVSIFSHKEKVRIAPPMAEYVNRGVPQ